MPACRVPELKAVPAKYIAEPHTMPREVQEQCKCVIGTHYPAPIVDSAVTYRHAQARAVRPPTRLHTLTSP